MRKINQNAKLIWRIWHPDEKFGKIAGRIHCAEKDINLHFVAA